MDNIRTSPPLSGIANLMEMQGRFGDTELVHMSKPEVKGLASLGRLTRNPDTGLLEAFSIGGFFKDYVVPAALFAIPVVGPYASAAYTGIKTGVETGSPLAGLTSGLLSYGMGKVGSKIMGSMFGTAAKVPDAGSFTAGLTKGAGSSGQKALQQGLTEAGKGANPFTTVLNNPSKAFPGVDIGSRVAGANIPGFTVGEGIKGITNVPVGERVGSLFGEAAAKGPLETFRGMSTRSLGQQFMKNLATPETAIRGLASGITADVTRGLTAKTPEALSGDMKTEVRDSGYGSKKFSMNRNYPQGLTTSQILQSQTGQAPPLQFTDPQYSPANTGVLSTTLMAKQGGMLDALDSITEGMEDLSDVTDGNINIEAEIIKAANGGAMVNPMSNLQQIATSKNMQQPFEGRVMGQGDGMSDEIPFSIEGEQPALLSRDEYVLPADIVSALGNGSSNAGADTLDKFMTAVRKKSMGRERQINEIG